MVSNVALLATAFLLYRERQWAKPVFREPEAAFESGSIGTEIMPLPVALTLPILAKHSRHFAPGGVNAGDWIEQFGFIRRGPNTPGPREPTALPYGFTLSNYRQKSGAPSPVQFVGIGCATCHSNTIYREDGSSTVVLGAGNTSLNLFAWLDAVQAALLEKQKNKDGLETDEYAITPESVFAEYERQTSTALNFEQKLMVKAWLGEFRETLTGNLPRFDDPYGRGKSFDPEITPTGPGRTQPFRTLVRNIMQRPGHNMSVYTKIASVYHQNRQEWAQVDGGIKDLNSRSALAVLAAGATLENMQVPEIRHNIIKASDFTRELSGPTFLSLFPDQKINDAAAKRGAAVYQKYCVECHGGPGAGGWTSGKRTGAIVPVAEVGTDKERVTFRHNDELPGKLFEHFPAKHPFHFKQAEIRATGGYLNEPIDSAFARAPYLHNASVLTLAELINLKERRTVFYRGRNRYDVADVGLKSPDKPDTENYFTFDTRVRGNGAQGHDYPWAYNSRDRNEQQLKDLLEYLKTL